MSPKEKIEELIKTYEKNIEEFQSLIKGHSNQDMIKRNEEVIEFLQIKIEALNEALKCFED